MLLPLAAPVNTSLIFSIYSSHVGPAPRDNFYPLIPPGPWLFYFTCLECPSRSCPPGRFFPLQETVETSHLGSLVRTIVPCLSLSGPRSQVNCWHLLYCGIYVSLSLLDSRLPEGKTSLLFISVSQCSVQAMQ